MVTSATVPSREAVLAVLAGVADPEIPNVSVVELGMIGEIAVLPDGIAVELLPTFVGCPAVEMISDSVRERLEGDLGVPVRVQVSYATPWSSERISPEGRRKLAASGFAPPPHLRASAGRALPVLGPTADPVPCPFCGSTRTRLENAFGPTQCRTIWYCADCRQPFEAFKLV